MATELFDMNDIGSVVRQLIRERGTVNLREFDIPPIQLTPDYKVKMIRLSTEKSIDEQIKIQLALPIIEAKRGGYKQENFLTPLYEAVLNACQHGNKGDLSKEIIVASRINPKKAEFLVIDEGGRIDAEFFSYIIRQRNGDANIGYVDFYTFAGRDRPSANFGQGLHTIHNYFDKVSFYRSPQGGLAVQMIKKKR